MPIYLLNKKIQNASLPARQNKHDGIIWHVVFGLVVFSLTLTFIVSSVKNIRLRYYALSINREISEIQKENTNLSRQIEAMKTDPVYREAIIRRELGMGEAGEIIIQRKKP